MKKYVVVGGGQAGVQAAISLRSLDDSSEITIISNEHFPPYHRPPLSKELLLSDIPDSRLFIRSIDSLRAKNIKFLSNCSVEKIDRDNALVHCNEGTKLAFDNLVIASGARPREIDVAGAYLSGVMYLRSLSDARQLKKSADKANNIVVIGGGFIGLEVAASMRKLGKKVTVVEAQDRLLNRVVDSTVSNFFMELHKKNGVEIIFNHGVSRFEGKGSISSVVLDNNIRIDADLVVIGIGVVPNVELAERAGLKVENGIVVDGYGKTNDDRIFAAGDCCNQYNQWALQNVRLESVPNAQEQGKLVASAIAGEPHKNLSIPWFWSHQYGVKLQIVGLNHDYDDIVIRGDITAGLFAAIYIKNDAVVAVDCINKPALFMQSKRLMQSKHECFIEDIDALIKKSR